ncbi:MAG: hypothetical protein HQ581_22370 [Planctomycetes bacterium]|nr:hypothetical protein [Planctomycetota bacterium]
MADKHKKPSFGKKRKQHGASRSTLEEKARAEQEAQQEIDAELAKSLAEEEETGYVPQPMHPLSAAGSPATRRCDASLAMYWSMPEEREKLLRELQSRCLLEQAALHRVSCQIASGQYTTLAEER